MRGSSESLEFWNPAARVCRRDCETGCFGRGRSQFHPDVFKDGHHQSFAMAEIVRIEFKAPAVSFTRTGVRRNFLPPTSPSLSLVILRPAKWRLDEVTLSVKWEVGQATAALSSSPSTQTERRGRVSAPRMGPGAWSMERLGSVGTMAGTTRSGRWAPGTRSWHTTRQILRRRTFQRDRCKETRSPNRSRTDLTPPRCG